MRKLFSLLFVAATSLFLYSSCKKTQHTTNPTPANYRIYSYTEVINGTYPANVYTFSYDTKNRVSQIIFTTSDSNIVKYGSGVGTRSVFYYSNDSIYKTNYVLQTGDTIDVDIFIQNTSGQIITSYAPSYLPITSTVVAPKKSTQFEYYGKLLSKVSDKYYHQTTTQLTSVSAAKVYRSDNADFLGYDFDGKLTANFSNSYTNPVAVIWTDALGKPTVHASTNYSDVLNGYTGLAETLTVLDQAMHTDTVVYPGGIQTSETYGVFPDKDNRPGDYLQIASFTMYGVNIYQQAHLTKSVKDLLQATNVVYDIDADSKIKTTTATVIGLTGGVTTHTYKFQYETY